MTEERLRSKFLGALLGTFVGDAVGAPVEGYPPDHLADTLDALQDMPAESGQRQILAAVLGLLGGSNLPGTARYTDDTQMMIGVAESLIGCGDFDGQDMAHRFAENFEGSRGYGPGAYGVLSALRKGARWDQAAAKLFGGGGSFGNGSAMRVAPVGLFYHRDLAGLRRVATLSASITHTHPLGKEGAVLQAHAVALATQGEYDHGFDRDLFVRRLRDFIEDESGTYQRQLDLVAELIVDPEPYYEVGDHFGLEFVAHESVPTAIHAFLTYPHSFREAVLYAVRIGGDTDTIGAMTGAIAGALHGVESIPSEWLSALENGVKGRDYVSHLGESLFEKWSQSTGKPG